MIEGPRASLNVRQGLLNEVCLKFNPYVVKSTFCIFPKGELIIYYSFTYRDI